MSQPSDYTPPYPEAVEIIECTQAQFHERFRGRDICFLLQETINDKWYHALGEQKDTKEQAGVWNLALLEQKDYSWPKRFHILPPIGVQPELVMPEGELSPGMLLFRALASNARPANDPRKTLEARLTVYNTWLASNQASIKLRIAIEAVAGYDGLFFTAQEHSQIRNALVAAETRYNAIRNAPLTPFTTNVRQWVQSHIED